VVGGPSREQLWILARAPRIAPELLARLRQRAEARGYVLDALLISQPER
jgi:lipocalin